jgi:hypothetical protein
MCIEVMLEVEELVLKIGRRPEERLIEILASDCADQPLHELGGLKDDRAIAFTNRRVLVKLAGHG